jgi:hypothetical protein
MKRFGIAALLLLVPALAFGTPSLGMYFSYDPTNPGQMHYSPMIGEAFSGFIYAHHWGCFLTAAEFMVEIPSGPMVYTGFELPSEDHINLGDPVNGIAISWFPPAPETAEVDYYLVCTVNFFAFENCAPEGPVSDFPIQIVPHPDSAGIFGTCWPDNYIFSFVGHRSILCPEQFSTENKSWGAIKALYR